MTKTKLEVSVDDGATWGTVTPQVAPLPLKTTECRKCGTAVDTETGGVRARGVFGDGTEDHFMLCMTCVRPHLPSNWGGPR